MPMPERAFRIDFANCKYTIFFESFNEKFSYCNSDCVFYLIFFTGADISPLRYRNYHW